MSRHDNRCANTELLNQYLDSQYKDAQALENFQSDVEPLLITIQESIDRMKEIAKSYEDYDFRYEIDDSVKELLWMSL